MANTLSTLYFHAASGKSLNSSDGSVGGLTTHLHLGYHPDATTIGKGLEERCLEATTTIRGLENDEEADEFARAHVSEVRLSNPKWMNYCRENALPTRSAVTAVGELDSLNDEADPDATENGILVLGTEREGHGKSSYKAVRKSVIHIPYQPSSRKSYDERLETVRFFARHYARVASVSGPSDKLAHRMVNETNKLGTRIWPGIKVLSLDLSDLETLQRWAPFIRFEDIQPQQSESFFGS